MPYILIGALVNDFSAKNLPEKLAQRILNVSSGVDYHYKIYEELDKALTAGKTKLPKTFAISMVEVGCSKNEIKELRKAFKANPTIPIDELLKKIDIKGIHTSGKFIPIEQFDYELVEKNHLKEMKYDPYSNEQFILKDTPLVNFKNLDERLWQLVFIDYVFFHLLGENWSHYHSREPGCVADLVSTYTKLILDGSNNQNEEAKLDDVLKIHASLTQNITKIGSPLKSGAFRDSAFTGFPITPSAATRDGIIEILQRIKNDKNPDGFMIGKIKKLGIMEFFANKMTTMASNYFYDHQQNRDVLADPENQKPIYDEFKIKAMHETIEHYKKEYDLTEDEIRTVLETDLKNFDKQVEEKQGSDFFWSVAKEFWDDQTTMTAHHVLKGEYKLNFDYSRKHPLACAGTHLPEDISNLGDEEIVQLADKIYREIQSPSSERIQILTPEIQTALKYAQKAFDTYNQSIQSAKTTDDKIKTVGNLVHELEMLHLFLDVNCRSYYLYMQQLLWKNGIKGSILYDPNRLDAYSSDELKEQIKQGICRFQYIIDNQEQHLEKNKNIDEMSKQAPAARARFWKPPQAVDQTLYNEIMKPLKEAVKTYGLENKSF